MTASSWYLNQWVGAWRYVFGFNYWFSFTLAHSRVSHEYSSLFIIVIDFFCFRSVALTVLEAFMRTDFFFIYFSIKSSIVTQGEVG